MERLAQKKQKLLSIFAAGGQIPFEIDLTPSHEEYTVQEGAMMRISCDVANHGEYNETDNVAWYVNTNLIEVGIIDWRIMIGDQQQLS